MAVELVESPNLEMGLASQNWKFVPNCPLEPEHQIDYWLVLDLERILPMRHLQEVDPILTHRPLHRGL